MGKQSSRLWYRGKDHKDIYFQGHYHDKMYKGAELIWEKLYDSDIQIEIREGAWYWLYKKGNILYLISTSTNKYTTDINKFYIYKYNINTQEITRYPINISIIPQYPDKPSGWTYGDISKKPSSTGYANGWGNPNTRTRVIMVGIISIDPLIYIPTELGNGFKWEQYGYEFDLDTGEFIQTYDFQLEGFNSSIYGYYAGNQYPSDFTGNNNPIPVINIIKSGDKVWCGRTESSIIRVASPYVLMSDTSGQTPNRSVSYIESMTDCAYCVIDTTNKTIIAVASSTNNYNITQEEYNNWYAYVNHQTNSKPHGRNVPILYNYPSEDWFNGVNIIEKGNYVYLLKRNSIKNNDDKIVRYEKSDLFFNYSGGNTLSGTVIYPTTNIRAQIPFAIFDVDENNICWIVNNTNYIYNNKIPFIYMFYNISTQIINSMNFPTPHSSSEYYDGIYYVDFDDCYYDLTYQNPYCIFNHNGYTYFVFNAKPYARYRPDPNQRYQFIQYYFKNSLHFLRTQDFINFEDVTNSILPAEFIFDTRDYETHLDNHTDGELFDTELYWCYFNNGYLYYYLSVREYDKQSSISYYKTKLHASQFICHKL